jgi:hypothetical protein
VFRCLKGKTQKQPRSCETPLAKAFKCPSSPLHVRSPRGSLTSPAGAKYADKLSSLTDEAVRAVAAACPRLTSLNLTGCKAVTDEAVQAVVAACPQLKSPILNRASMGTLDYSMK